MESVYLLIVFLMFAGHVKGFSEVICGPGKGARISCAAGQSIAIERLYGCETCQEGKCYGSVFLDKLNMDKIWSRCNRSSSCNIRPTGLTEGHGLGLEYHCTANATGCYGDQISLYCRENQTIQVTNLYRLNCCPDFGNCAPRETELQLNKSKLGKEISQQCGGARTCRRVVSDNAVRVHYICLGVYNQSSHPHQQGKTTRVDIGIKDVPLLNTKLTTAGPKFNVKNATSSHPPPRLEVVEAKVFSINIIIIVLSASGVTFSLLIVLTVVMLCRRRKTSYIVTPRKPSVNYILDDGSDLGSYWKLPSNIQDGAQHCGGMKGNDLDLRVDKGYLSLKENDLYQGLDELEVQRSGLNHIDRLVPIPEGVMKENDIYMYQGLRENGYIAIPRQYESHTVLRNPVKCARDQATGKKVQGHSVSHESKGKAKDSSVVSNNPGIQETKTHCSSGGNLVNKEEEQYSGPVYEDFDAAIMKDSDLYNTI